jgi:hypothetical protein
MIILVGVAIVVVALGIINFDSALASLRGVTGIVLVAAVLIVLFATLFREARGR